MALKEVNLSSWKWTNGTIQLGNSKFPVAVLNLDFGEDIVLGDTYRVTNWQDVMGTMPTGLVTLIHWQRNPSQSYNVDVRGIFDYLPWVDGETAFDQFFPFESQAIASYTYQLGGRAALSRYGYQWNPVLTKDGSKVNLFAVRYVGTTNQTWSLYSTFIVRDIRSGKYITKSTWSGCTNWIDKRITEVTAANIFGIVEKRTYLGSYYFAMVQWENVASFNATDFYFPGDNEGVSNSDGFLPPDVGYIIDPDAYDPFDPYFYGGNSTEDPGGDTDFDEESEIIPDDDLPPISIADTGFARIYNPTLSQMQNLASYLWTTPSVTETIANHIKQFFESPIDAFIALNMLPCAVRGGAPTEFKVMFLGTGVQMNTAANQFEHVDCGTVHVPKHYDSALDFNPYTKIHAFLPYIGYVQLNADEMWGKDLHLVYNVDIVSGVCVAKILIDDSVRYQFSGHCAISLPFNSSDFTGYLSAIIQATKLVGSVAAGAAGAGELSAAFAGAPSQRTGETVTQYTRQQLNPETGRMRMTDKITATETGTTKASFGSIVRANVSNLASAVTSGKLNIERSGGFSGNAGAIGNRRPYIIIERPRMCNPSEYGKYNGRPALLTLYLKDCHGYTEVQQVQLTGIPATNPELDEIYSLLKGGVIL